MRFTVIVADNSRYSEDREGYEFGSFETAEDAIAAAKQIVDDYLASAYRPGMTAKALYGDYMMFGEDPYVVSSGRETVPFSAWDYAKQRCAELCSPK